MAIHLAFVESKVTDTGYDLLKEMRRDARKLEGTIMSHVVALQTEEVIVGGVKEEVSRLFVKAKDSGDYANTGWILSHHLKNCMICNYAFTTLHPRHHCRACGNLVCHKCAPDKAPITELIHVGPQRVCVQCYYGQEEVHAVALLDRAKLHSAQDRYDSLHHDRPRSHSGEHTYAQELHEKKELYAQKMQEAKEAAEAAKESLAALVAKKESRRRVFLAAAKERKEKEEALKREMEGLAIDTHAEPSIFNLQLGDVLPVVEEGPMRREITITPTPGFVMKTHRADGSKVFVNVCCHSSVKKGDDPRLSHLKHEKDKSGGAIAVYDAVISREAMEAANADIRLAVQLKIGLDILRKLVAERHEKLDTEKFTTPLIKHNYKGDKVSTMKIEVVEVAPPVVASGAPMNRRGFMKRDAPSENVMRPSSHKNDLSHSHSILSSFQ